MHLRKTPEPKLRIYSVDAKLRTFPLTEDNPKVQLRAHLRPYPRSPASRTRTCKRAPRYLGVRLRGIPNNTPRLSSLSYLTPLFGHYCCCNHPLFYFPLLLFVYSSEPILAEVLSYSFRTSC